MLAAIEWENLSHASAFAAGLVLGATYTILVMRIVTRYIERTRDPRRDEAPNHERD